MKFSKDNISIRTMYTSQVKHARVYILYIIMMEMKYRVPTKSCIHHTYLVPLLHDDSNYTSKQITEKHFTSKLHLQKTKYCKTNNKPIKFRL